MRKSCADCGRQGHEAAPGHANCSRSFRAVQEIAKGGLSMREAAKMFGVNPCTLGEELRSHPEAWRLALARSAEVMAQRSPRVLAELAARAVADDGSPVSRAARAYGASAQMVRAALRRTRPDWRPRAKRRNKKK